MFCDIFYSTIGLAQALKDSQTYFCGTIVCNRLPPQLKYAKAWANQVQRGAVRYVRNGNWVCIQLCDHKPVAVLTTKHRATDEDVCQRRILNPETGHHELVDIRRPVAITNYNEFMGGEDIPDQLIGYYESLRPTRQYWKTLLFHFIDIAVMNSWVLFCLYREAHPDAIDRPNSNSHSDFIDALIRQLAGIPLNADVPVTGHGHTRRASLGPHMQ